MLKQIVVEFRIVLFFTLATLRKSQKIKLFYKHQIKDGLIMLHAFRQELSIRFQTIPKHMTPACSGPWPYTDTFSAGDDR